MSPDAATIMGLGFDKVVAPDVIAVPGPKPDARAVVQPKPASWPICSARDYSIAALRSNSASANCRRREVALASATLLVRRHVFKGGPVVGVMRLIIAGGVIVVPPDSARVIGSRVPVIIES